MHQRIAQAAVIVTLLSGALGAPSASAEPLPGQIAVDPADPRWLVYERDADGDGQRDPFYLCGPGDPEGFLYRGTRNPDGTRDGDQQALIDKLAPTGANAIYMQVVRSHGGDGGADHNPFVDSDPALGLDQQILDQWEGWFSAMDEAGITIYLFLYDDSASIWDGDGVGSAERDFVHSIVDRFEHHRHLIWVVAEEYQEAFSDQRVAALATEIRAADDHDHPIAVHTLVSSQLAGLADEPNIDQHALQVLGGDSDWVHERVELSWEAADGRYNLNMSELADHGSGQSMRRKNWASGMAGAYVMVLGMDVASTSIADLEACGRQRAFFEATDFTEMAPRDDLALAGTDHVLALPGHSYIAYADGLAGEIGLRELQGGSYAFTWMDTATGQTVEESRDVAAGDRSWAPPAELGQDVVVWIRRVGAPDNVPPTALPASVTVPAGATVSIPLDYADPDGPGPYAFDVVSAPAHGTLSGAGPAREYTPEPGYAGPDALVFVVHDGLHGSAAATVDVAVLPEDNAPPEAASLLVRIPQGTPSPVTLPWADPDGGPGPYTIEIVDPPAEGVLEGAGSTRTYIPATGFLGPVTVRWRVHDGEDVSAVATLHIVVFPPFHGLSGRWALDEPAGTIAGNSAGVAVGHLHGAAWTEGRLGGALEFDGVDDRVEIDGPFVPPEQGTLAVWIRPALSGGQERVLGGADGWELTLEPGGVVQVQLGPPPAGVIEAPVPLQPGVWAHVAWAWDQLTGELRLYVNGEEVAASFGAAANPDPMVLTLGHRTGAADASTHFEGRIDEVRLYGRMLLPQEIAARAALGGGGF